MPLYEFKCKECKKEFDKILTIKEMESIKVLCPQCNSEEVAKLISSGRIKIGLGGYAGKIR